MQPERARRARAEQIEGLHLALQLEFRNIRDDAANWGLDPVGLDRVLAAVAVFEASTAVDMTTWHAGQVDVLDILTARYTNVRDLKKACKEGVSRAMRCEWLAEWLAEAEHDVGAGIPPALGTKAKVLA